MPSNDLQNKRTVKRVRKRPLLTVLNLQTVLSPCMHFIRTRQNHLHIKQICLGVFTSFDINEFQLSNVYGLAELMLSFYYHGNVITFGTT